jgi:hypothetical protein
MVILVGMCANFVPQMDQNGDIVRTISAAGGFFWMNPAVRAELWEITKLKLDCGELV